MRGIHVNILLDPGQENEATLYMVSRLKSHFDVQICAKSHGDCKHSSSLCKHLCETPTITDSQISM